MTPLLTRVACLLACGMFPATETSAGWFGRGDEPRGRLADLRWLEVQQPLRTRLVTLSRDGRHLAYTVEGATTAVEVLDLDAPAHRQRFELGDVGGARLLVLEWTSAQRLVAALESGVLIALDTGATEARVLLDPTRFARTFAPWTGAGAAEEPTTTSVPRWPQFLHVRSDEPDVIHVLGTAGTGLSDAVAEVARVEVATGRWRIVDTLRIPSAGTRLLADREGRLRLVEDRSRLPLRWQVRVGPEATRFDWKPLDQVLPPGTHRGFEGSPDQLLQARSVPLGFGPDPQVLYLASCVDRSTYAIEAIDLPSGVRTTVLADPEIDLAAPDDRPAGGRGRAERGLRRANPAAYATDATMAPADRHLVFDRATGELAGVRVAHPRGTDRWIDPVLGAVQAELETDFPGRKVRLLDWDDARERIALLVTSAADPGRYFVYRRSSRRCVEYLRRAPWMTPDRLHPTRDLQYADETGRIRHARLTLPRRPLVTPAPVVCVFPGDPWTAPETDDPRLRQTLAELGCVVLETEPRFQRVPEPDAQQAPDAAAAADMAAALAAAAREADVRAKRAVTLGTGFGAWLALRSAALRPEVFRGVVALNPVDSLAQFAREWPEWEGRDPPSAALAEPGDVMAHLEAIRRDFQDTGEAVSVVPGSPGLPDRPVRKPERAPRSVGAEILRQYFAPAVRDPTRRVTALADRINGEVCLIQDADNPFAPARTARALRRALQAAGGSVTYWEAPAAEWDRPLLERPEVWTPIAEFLFATLYRYEVEVGEMREVKP